MKHQVSWGGKLKSYLEWPIFVIVLLLIMDVAVFACNKQAGLVALLFTCIYLIVWSHFFSSISPRLEGAGILCRRIRAGTAPDAGRFQYSLRTIGYRWKNSMDES